MRKALQQLLREFKADIVSALSEGTLLALLDELSYYFVDEDRQKIKCDAGGKGYSWAVDTLIDTLRCSDEEAFTKFLQFLKNNNSTQRLYNNIADECRKRSLEFVLASVDKNSKESLHSLIKKITPDIVDALSEGELTCILQHFEIDLFDTDVQKIKCDLNNHGKNRAISQMIECLLYCDEETLKKFIKDLLDRKKSIFINIKLEEYGLQHLLSKPAAPVEEKGATPSNPTAVCNIESLPVMESIKSSSSDSPPAKELVGKE